MQGVKFVLLEVETGACVSCTITEIIVYVFAVPSVRCSASLVRCAEGLRRFLLTVLSGMQVRVTIQNMVILRHSVTGWR